MRGKICIFVAALAALLALQGCMRRDAVIFQGISDVEVSMEASPRVGVVLLVENGRRDGEGRMPEENVRSGEDASVGVSEVFRGKRIVLSRRLNCVL